MTQIAGAQAIVTGAGSGIGAALSRALVAAGAHVTCTDIDADAAARTAQRATGPGSASAAGLDVTDAAAVQSLVDDVVARTGRVDLMFNNAGISLAGDTTALTLDQWNRIIDINIRGVVHGVTAAYPQMIRQGGGHIVNTASMAGLAATGFLTSYVMTKHAVVGLSLALRSEAAGLGVGVLVVCPGAVETPILDNSSVGGFDSRKFYLAGLPGKTPYSADKLARETLRAVERNKAILVAPRESRLAWTFARLAPNLMQRMSIRFVAEQRQAQSPKAVEPTEGKEQR